MPKEVETVHVGNAWRMLLRDLGLDEVAILRRSDQPESLLQGGGSRITLDDYYTLHRVVADEANDPAFALRTGQIFSVELFDPALFAALCSPDMNTAATRMGQFKRLVGPFSLDVSVLREQTRIEYRCKHRPDVPWALALSELVFLVAFARRATRHEVRPLRLAVREAPSDPEPYETYFGCPVERGDVCTLALSAGDASRPFLTHNDRMWETFEPSLRRRMAEAENSRSASAQVETVLFELLPSGRTELKDVAKALGMGTRTLQRRLADENTTWLAVLGQTRERLARHYLQTTEMSPAEVSFLLGFEDPNSLFRAFHRWTGTTPESWRAEVRAQ